MAALNDLDVLVSPTSPCPAPLHTALTARFEIAEDVWTCFLLAPGLHRLLLADRAARHFHTRWLHRRRTAHRPATRREALRRRDAVPRRPSLRAGGRLAYPKSHRLPKHKLTGVDAMTDTIRVGIIGANANYGWSKRAHLPALLGMPDFELTAVCTSRPETAEESKAFYGANLAFHDYTEMANHPDVDLVVVSVSVLAHYGMVTAGLQAGKHVFCEWPLGANTVEAVELASLAHDKGVRTLIGLQARGGPALLRLRQLVAEGYVGDMLSCNMTMFLPGLMGRGADRAWMADRAKGANSPQHRLRPRPRHILPLRRRVQRVVRPGKRATGPVEHRLRQHRGRGARPTT